MLVLRFNVMCVMLYSDVDLIFWNMEWLCSVFHSSQFLWFVHANYAGFWSVPTFLAIKHIIKTSKYGKKNYRLCFGSRFKRPGQLAI